MTKLETAHGVKEQKVVSQEEWLAARKALLSEEKKFSRLRDQLTQQRQNLPWVKIDKEYAFEGPDGEETLADLFDGKSQLIVYHFMFAPDDDEGCAHCSFWADHFDSVNLHLPHRDTAFVSISRAPLKKLQAFKKRMGWDFKWLSSGKNDFNYDFHVSFTPEQIRAGDVFYNYVKSDMDMEDLPGVSTFYKNKDGDVFHTYSAYSRGIDLMNTTYNFLDLTAKGRNENPERPQEWVRYHDRYSTRA
jgi:predicted dithiol-disulfide oxidoreductase (DUF899 family)